MKPFLLLFLFTLQGFVASSQRHSSEVKQLLNLAANRKGTFVLRQPIQRLYSSWWRDTTYFYESNRISRLSKQDLPMRKLAELVKSSATLDTAAWTRQELDSVVLVTNRADYLSARAELLKLDYWSEQLTKYYKKAIRRFNNTEVSERNIMSFSRPVFDSSNTYALIEFDNGYQLSGGGAIVLYKWDAKWRKVGTVVNWAH